MEFIYNTIGLLDALKINSPAEIEDAIELLSPSMADYFIEDSLISEAVAPRNNFIQSVLVIGNYKIITDYNDNVFIERKVDTQDSTNLLF